MTARRQNPPANWTVRSGRLLPSVAVMAVLTVSALPAHADQAMPFLAHRAVYDLALDADPSRPAVEAARGRIVYEFSGSACEGYTQNFRQVAELEGGDFGSRLIDSRSASYEQGDGRMMRFSNSIKVNDKDRDNTEGAVESKDDQVVINLTAPVPETVTAKEPVRILFPTEHYMRLVAAALQGETTFEARIFDGTGDGKTISDSFAIIGKAKPAGSVPATLLSAGMTAMRHWPITVAYFDGKGAESETPSYSMAMELYENGVADALTLNYGEFVLKATLTEIETLPQKPCP